MSHLLLTSNGFFTEEIITTFQQYLKNKPHLLNAVIITTASPKKESHMYAIQAKDKLIDMGFRQVDFLDIEFEAPNKLVNYDVIYISGGNPFTLLHHLRLSGADQLITDLFYKHNIFIVGASAGAVVLGPSIEVVQYFTPHMNIHNLHNLAGLSLTSAAIFPHYDREDVFQDSNSLTIEQRLQIFEKQSNLNISLLKDTDYIFL